MGKKLERIFNECVERILQGESIEDCLRSYPKNAAELEPLLKATVNLSRRGASFDPLPAFKALARARIEGAQLYARHQPKKTDFSTWPRAWAPALASVCILLFGSVGTVAASSDAMPDETLYPVKQATENIRLTLTFSDASKAKLHTDLAENRSEEIVAMATQGNAEQVIVLTGRLANNLTEAQDAITRIEAAESKQPKATPAAVPAPEPPPAPPEPMLSPAPSQVDDTDAVDTPQPEDEVEKPVKPDVKEPSEPETPQPTTPEVVEPETAESTKVSKLKKSLDDSISKNLEILENALDQAPEKVKPALEQAIKMSQKSYQHEQQKGGDKDNPTPSTPEDHQDEGDDSQNNQQPTDENNDDAAQQGTKNGENNNPTAADPKKKSDSANGSPTASATTDNSTGEKKSSMRGKGAKAQVTGKPHPEL